jgi:uncharacterized protein (TIGR00266 family)
MSDWYLAIDGQQQGPFPEPDVLARLRSGAIDGETLVYGDGLAEWTALKKVPALQQHAAVPAAVTPAPAAGRKAHEIDYKIYGDDMQFVEVELDPGESAVAEAGTLMFMTQGIEMETIFGDGSQQAQQGGFMSALMGAGKRLLTGESLFMTVFTNARGPGKQKVAFAAPYAGKIISLDLSKLGGHMVCQKDSFLCAARGVSIGIAFQKKLGVGLFGGEGFIMQKLEGDGLCFAHAGGTIHALDLGPGETLRVDTGCLVALQPSVNYDIQFVGKVKTALFGGEGLFFATLTGPGKVWLQSLPLSRLAGRIFQAAPQTGSSGREEGSILNAAMGIGRIVGGNG